MLIAIYQSVNQNWQMITCIPEKKELHTMLNVRNRISKIS